MTIEDGLEELEEKEKKEPEAEKEPETAHTEITAAAKELVGRTYANYLEHKLPGQRDSGATEIADKFKEYIIKKSWDLFDIEPEKGDDDDIILRPVLHKNNGLTKDLLQILFGDYVLKTDIAKMTEWDNICETVPELYKLEKSLVGNETINWRRATFHPQLIAAKIPLEYRPLAVMAVAKAIAERDLMLPSAEIDTKPSKHDVLSITNNMTPKTQHYLAAAEEFSITEDLVETIKQYKRACDLYVSAWGD